MRLLLIILSVFILSACAMPEAKRDKAREDISREMQEASKQRTQEATERALLAPLVVTPPVIRESEPRFDLSVVNAPVQQVLMAIVNGTRYSMLMTPDVSGNVTINLKNVTVVEALDSVRDLYGYEYRMQGNRISIQPNTIQSRVFQVNYLSALRTGETELRVSSGGVGNTVPASSMQSAVPTQTSTGPQTTPSNPTSRVRTTSNSDFWGTLTAALTAIVGNAEGRNVVVNPMAGVVLVRAYPKELRAAEQYLRAIQAIADRQVMLEAKIIEVTLSDSFHAGVNWAGFGGINKRNSFGVMQPGSRLAPTGADRDGLRSGTDGIFGIPGEAGRLLTTDRGQGFFGLALQTSNFAALINFLETQGSVSVLSSPRVSTMNNQKAVLKVGTDELYVTNVTTTTTTGSADSVVSPTITLQPYFSGISLDVTPQIDEDDNIVLHIHPAVTTVTEKEKTIDLGQGGIFKLPLAALTVNETDSIVRARDGYIVALGGLMSASSQTDSSGLPGTTHTDVGGLLGQRSRANLKRELVILLKPTLIKDEKSWQQDIDATTQRIERMGGIESQYPGR